MLDQNDLCPVTCLHGYMPCRLLPPSKMLLQILERLQHLAHPHVVERVSIGTEDCYTIGTRHGTHVTLCNVYYDKAYLEKHPFKFLKVRCSALSPSLHCRHTGHALRWDISDLLQPCVMSALCLGDGCICYKQIWFLKVTTIVFHDPPVHVRF